MLYCTDIFKKKLAGATAACDRRSASVVVAIWLAISACQVFAQETNSTEAAETAAKLQMLGTIRDRDVDESSGLAIGRSTGNAFWTLNDSAHPAELFLISTAAEDAGRTKLVCTLENARNIDWEAMAPFQRDGKDCLLAADVGDNSQKRSSYQLYVIEEPRIDANGEKAIKPNKLKSSEKKRVRIDLPARKIVFRYEDGPHDCEAVGVDPLTNDVWLIEKIYSTDPRKIQSGIYKISMPDNSDKREQVAFRIGDFPIRNVTGLAFSPDGQKLIVRNYLNAHLYTREDNQSWEETVREVRPTAVILPLQSQGEAICFTADSKFVIITSEFARSTIWKVAIE